MGGVHDARGRLGNQQRLELPGAPAGFFSDLAGSDKRQRAIADAISRRATNEFKPQRPDRSGTQRAPNGDRGVMKITQEGRGWAVTWAFWLRAWQDSNPRPAANPKIGELAGRRQHPAERSGAGFLGWVVQAAGWRVTV
jgi:hypothetical protein